MLFEKQQYQQDCVDNIMRALDGVDFAAANFGQIAAGLRELQQQNTGLKNFPILNNKPRLDVLMETGTGKTFVYLQTILELNKRHGQTKFIIVLPRAAIKQGVIQNIKLTGDYFNLLYKKRIKYINFPQDGLAQVHQDFIRGGDLSVLIITNSAFNSGKNNINQKTESLPYQLGSTWEGISDLKPVVIIDEPHLLEGPQTLKALGKLNRSLFIRFGATFPTETDRQLGNVAYSLNSINAFNQYLVKGIGVSTVYAGNQQSNVAVTNVRPREECFDFCHSQNGQPRRATIRIDDDIGAKSGAAEYNGVVATKITAETVFLSNRQSIPTKIPYTLGDNEIRLMLREAITRHFAKEEGLFVQGIKALTLSFISSVADFRGDSPRVKGIFEKEYKAIRERFYKNSKNKKYRAYLDRDFSADGRLLVHEGYFSGDKGSKDEKEQKAVDIILNDKEKLLSFSMPLRFVFSVWALQEGWDNPNICVICKLAASDKDTSRRQQVGRGLRLAVNQTGRRMTHNHLNGDNKKFKEINTVDVVVSAQEQTFIHEIQKEINAASPAEVGDVINLDMLQQLGLKDNEASRIYNALQDHGVIDENGQILSKVHNFLVANRDKFPKIEDECYREICEMFNPQRRVGVRDNNATAIKVKIRRRQWEEFKRLWEEINRKAKVVYQAINEDELIEKISGQFNRETVDEVVARVERKTLNTQENKIENKDEYALKGGGQKLPAMSKIALSFMQEEQKELPVGFVCRLFEKLDGKKFYNDEAKAKKILREAIEKNIHGNILRRVDYEFAETKVYPNALQDENGDSVGELAHTKLGKYIDAGAAPNHFLYDSVVYDSGIERECAKDPENAEGGEITVFAKLPEINIPTPYKNYNPDFAYLITHPDRNALFLVVETKGYNNEGDISAAERQKIAYGRKFFKKLQELLRAKNIDVRYESRLNKESLSQLLRRIYNGDE